MSKRIIGINGLPRSGKDTLADQLVTRDGMTKMAFADPVYWELSEAFNVSQLDLRSDLWKLTPQAALEPRRCNNPEFIKVCQNAGMFADEPMTSRRALQTWGTEYKRKVYGHDYWAKILLSRLAQCGMPSVVIPDLREDTEAAVLLKLVSRHHYCSFEIVEVVREGTKSTGHSSDHGLSRSLIDVTVTNQGSPEDLYHKALRELIHSR